MIISAVTKRVKIQFYNNSPELLLNNNFLMSDT